MQVLLGDESATPISLKENQQQVTIGLSSNVSSVVWAATGRYEERGGWRGGRYPGTAAERVRSASDKWIPPA
jgi:hypothetical protein